MLKRKKRTRSAVKQSEQEEKQTPVENIRFRRLRIILEEMAFDLTIPAQATQQWGVQRVEGDKEGNRVHYEVRFEPPLDRRTASNCYICVTHLPSKRRDVNVVVLPNTQDKVLRSIDERWHYIVFPSHAVKLEGTAIASLYMTLCNEQTRGTEGAPPLYGLDFKPQNIARYHPLSWWPPVELPGVAIDASQYPQGHPLTFKAWEGITGSRIPKLLGYFAKSKDGFSSWAAASMRFGRLKEMTAVQVYLDYFPVRQFYETGYHSVEAGSAQPDGLIWDPENTEPIEEYADLDPTRGVIEIKSSKSNCTFDGSYIAQCLWEMMACNVGWCDLMRYAEYPVKNEHGKWVVKHSFRVVRIFRHRATEERLVSMVRAALAGKLEESEAGRMRAQFDELARVGNTTGSIEIDTPLHVLEAAEAYKRDYFAKHALHVDIVDPLLQRIEERQAHVFALFQEKRTDEFTRVVAEQMQDYALLLLAEKSQ